MNIGLIGTGSVARAVAEDICSHPSMAIISVVARNDERLKRFAKDFEIQHYSTNPTELLQRSDVDVVYIATPAATHAELAISMLEHGKPVLIEKPFATSLKDGIRITQAARKHNLFCMEAMWMRFLPCTKAALESVDCGAIGEPFSLNAQFGVPTSFAAGHHNLDAEHGGAWLDRGVYGLSLALMVFERPRAVSCATILGSSGCDLETHAVIGFEGNKLATISASFLSYSTNEAVLAGEFGRLKIHETFVRPEDFCVKEAPSQNPQHTLQRNTLLSKIKTLPLAKKLKPLLESARKKTFPAKGNGYVYEFEEVQRCLQKGLLESPHMTWEHSLTILELCDQVRQQRQVAAGK